MIREFKIKDNRRLDFGQVYDGYYLPDGSGDVQVLTPKGHEVLFFWEFELVKY
jgi:hypothetical protein